MMNCHHKNFLLMGYTLFDRMKNRIKIYFLKKIMIIILVG